MKNIIYSFILIGITTISCSKDKTCNEIKLEACEDNVPIEDCLANFERWFFVKDENSCEKIRYAGCSQKGFATKQECEECKCH